MAAPVRSTPDVSAVAPDVRFGPPRRLRDRRALILGTLCISLLMVSLDNTVLNVALPTLVRDLHSTDSQLQWIVDAYAVAFAGLMLVLGSLGDRLGRKWMLVAGLVVFVAGSAASAFAGSSSVLIATRAVMGVGAAGIMPGTLAVLTAVFNEPRERSRAIGVWSGTSGLGIALGPLIGGWLLANFWWGSVFLINVPIGLLGIVAVCTLAPNSLDPDADRIDLLGAIASVAGMGLLVWGIIEAPVHGWGSGLTIGAMSAGLAILAAFVLWERHTDHPLLDVSVFTSRRFSSAMGGMAAVIFVLFGTLFLLTQYLQFSLGYTALQTGVRVLPVALVLFVVAPMSTVLVRFVGTKAVVTVALVTISAGLFLISRTTVSGGYTNILPALLILGLGAGLTIAPATDSVMGSLPPEHAAVGAATNGTAIQLGGALGVAVLGSLLNTRYQDHMVSRLHGQPVPTPILHTITGSLGGALAVAAQVGGTLGTALASIARSAFVSGVSLAMVVGAAVALAAAVLVLLTLPSRPTQGPPQHSWGDRPQAGD